MKGKLTISIAMCTYNGSRFLQEQFNSLLAQSHLPDELVICDDCSQDNTINIIEAFSQQTPFPVRIYKNPQNLGFAKNFEKAASLCSGDIIFFSDQDDVWLPDKLKRIYQVFLNDSTIGLVFSDASIVDINLNDLGYSLWDIYCLNKNGNKFFLPETFIPYFFLHTAIAGCTTAIRADLCRVLSPLPDHWAHDQWFPFGASILSSVALLCDKLIKFRQHKNQLYGNRKPNFISKLINYSRPINNNYKVSCLRDKLIWLEAIIRITNDENISSNNVKKLIKSYLNHKHIRYNLPGSRVKRIPFILKELLSGNYHCYSNGLSSLAKDIFINGGGSVIY